MLCKAYGIPPKGIINKHYCKLKEAKVYLMTNAKHQRNTRLFGDVVEISIEVPKVYSFDVTDDMPTIGTFKRYVERLRMKVGILETVYLVTHLTAQLLKRANCNSMKPRYSNGGTAHVTFLSAEDLVALKELGTLLPDNPTYKEAQALSNLYAALRKNAFLTDADGEVVSIFDYLSDHTPMFSITDIKIHQPYSFTTVQFAYKHNH